jgi:hypothetical protein
VAEPSPAVLAEGAMGSRHIRFVAVTTADVLMLSVQIREKAGQKIASERMDLPIAWLMLAIEMLTKVAQEAAEEPVVEFDGSVVQGSSLVLHVRKAGGGLMMAIGQRHADETLVVVGGPDNPQAVMIAAHELEAFAELFRQAAQAVMASPLGLDAIPSAGQA